MTTVTALPIDVGAEPIQLVGLEVPFAYRGAARGVLGILDAADIAPSSVLPATIKELWVLEALLKKPFAMLLIHKANLQGIIIKFCSLPRLNDMCRAYLPPVPKRVVHKNQIVAPHDKHQDWLRAIQSLSCPSGSIREFIRDRILLADLRPTARRPGAQRIWEQAVREGKTATRNCTSILTQLSTLLKDGLRVISPPAH